MGSAGSGSWNPPEASESRHFDGSSSAAAKASGYRVSKEANSASMARRRSPRTAALFAGRACCRALSVRSSPSPKGLGFRV